MSGETLQGRLFDQEKGDRLKQEGMAKAAQNNVSDLLKARQIAIRLCAEHGEVNADDVGRLMKKEYGVASLGPSAGSLFKGGQFEFTGKRVISHRSKNHGREIKVWRFKTV